MDLTNVWATLALILPLWHIIRLEILNAFNYISKMRSFKEE